MNSIKSLPLVLVCCLIFFSSVSGLGIDRKSKSIDFSQTNCPTSYYSACAVRNSVFLVRQVLNDLKNAQNTTVISQIFSLINAGGMEYRLGLNNSFTVSVWRRTSGGLVLVADNHFPNLAGQNVDQYLTSTTTLESPVFAQRLTNFGTIGGAWLDGFAYNYSSSTSVPTARRYWVDSTFAVDGSTYIVSSGFDNVDIQLVGRRCTAKLYAPCAVEVIMNLVGLVAKEMSQISSSQLSTLLSNIASSPKYRVREGFTVTVIRASDGVVVAHGGNSTYVGRTFASLTSTANLNANISAAVACGGGWIVQNWRDNPTEAEYQRQFWVVPVSVGGINYYVLSGVGTTDDEKCPPCNCPGCPPVANCPICPEVTSCDGAEVTNFKLDFTGMV